MNDIAFSGDGEPTSFSNFDTIVADVAAVKVRRGLGSVKLVLITNASLLHRPRVRQALETLDRHQGEIWAKLDAGTESYYRRISRAAIPLERILRNLGAAARVRPLVIQSLFLRQNGAGPPPSEIAAYADRLREHPRPGRPDRARSSLHGRPPPRGRRCPGPLPSRARRHRGHDPALVLV